MHLFRIPGDATTTTTSLATQASQRCKVAAERQCCRQDTRLLLIASMYSAVLRSLADSLRSCCRMLDSESVAAAFHGAFLTIHPSGVRTYSAILVVAWLVPREAAAV